MYIHIYVCMYACVSMYTYIYIYVHMHKAFGPKYGSLPRPVGTIGDQWRLLRPIRDRWGPSGLMGRLICTTGINGMDWGPRAGTPSI